MDFIIDRSKWFAGGESYLSKEAIGQGDSYMLNYDGYMCALGFCGLQLGIEKENLLGLIEPKSMSYNIFTSKESRILALEKFSLLKDFEDEMVYINDHHKFNTEEREFRLKELFVKNGHTISFIGKSEKRRYWEDSSDN